MAAAGLFGVASPAFAQDPTVTITGLQSGSLPSGGTTNLTFKVKNNNPNPNSANVKVTFTGDLNGLMSCEGNCDLTQEIPGNGGEASFSATLRADNVAPGQTKNGQVRISADLGGGDDAEASRNLSVQGPQQAQTVPEISGTVVDVYTSNPIAAAKVFLQDSGNPSQNWSVGTDDKGNWRITSEPGKPISPGIVSIKVEKEGIQEYVTTKQAVAGQPLLNVRLSVTPMVSASAGPSATGDPSASAPVSGLPTEQGQAFPEPDEGGLSWVLIAVGGLLVALGVGAIVLLFVKRKGDGDEDGDRPPGGRRGGPPGPGRGGPRPPHPQRRGGPPDRTAVLRGPGGPGGPGGPPGHDPHRPMRPVSPGPRGADQTMIARSPLADAPTQLHRSVEPDPYGARPASPHAPYQGGGYGPQPPQPPGGYGQQAAAYPGGAPPYGQQPDPYGQPGYGAQTDPYGRPVPVQPAQPAYGQPYGQQPDPYAPNPDPRAPRSGQDPRRVDWLDD
jgi:hypothetical protein